LINRDIKLSWGVEHRLQNLEHFTDTIHPSPLDVYSRLKALEDRLLLLEDTGYLEYLKKKDKPATSKKEESQSKLPIVDDSSSPSIIGNPQLADPNKRIAELMASLQKKSTESSKQQDEK